MNPFDWLRKQVAQAIVLGWEDGLNQVASGCGSESRSATTPEIADASENHSADPAAPPLAAWVERLRLPNSGTAPTTNSNSPRRPRKRKDNDQLG